MNKCVFCRIANKELESKIISETESSIAFLDVNPVSPGHTLVIPKLHSKDIDDTTGEILSEMMTHTKKSIIIPKGSIGSNWH